MKEEYISFEVLLSCTCNSESWSSRRRAALYKRFKSVLDLISEGIKQQEANYRVKRPKSVFTGVGLFFSVVDALHFKSTCFVHLRSDQSPIAVSRLGFKSAEVSE